MKKEKIKILKICCGAGCGGIALSKLLLEKKLNIDLIITDLRKEALKGLKNWGKRKREKYLNKGI